MALNAPVTIYGPTGEALTSVARSADGQQVGQPPRLGGRGEQFVYNLWNGMQALATEGSYWMAATATPGTGITLSVATGVAFADTQALLVLNNTDSLGGKTIYLDFVRVIVTTAPATATSWSCAHRIDSATRGTAGTQIGATTTFARPSNMNYAGNSIGQCFALGASAVSVASSANVRNAGRNTLRGQIPVVLDDITIKYGSSENAAGGVGISQATVGGITVYAPAIAIGPQQSYVLNEWAAARTGALSGELIIGWVER